MTPKIIIGPTAEPVTLDEVKLALSIDGTGRDTRITKLIKAAREQAEFVMERAIMTQTLEVAIDAFPRCEIEIPYPKLLSIVSVKYDDTAGAEQTLAANLYRIDNYKQPGYVFPANGTSWPSTLAGANAVRVRYTAGYGPEASYVPEKIKEWISQYVGGMLAVPDGLIDSRIVEAKFVERLLDEGLVVRC